MRIMPDVHDGKGCVIGTTMIVNDKICPNIVGVDIGCGMLAVEFAADKIDFAELDDTIKTHIPCGFNIRRSIYGRAADFDLSKLHSRKKVLGRGEEAQMRAIGTLGGGKRHIFHFRNRGHDRRVSVCVQAYGRNSKRHGGRGGYFIRAEAAL